MNNKKIFIGLGIAFIISLNIYNIPQKKEKVEVPNQAVEFIEEDKININQLNKTLSKSLGTSVDLKKYKNVIVTFWATWCPSCHRENVVFNEFTQNNKNIFIVGICVDKNKKALATYQEKLVLNFPVVNINKDIAILFDDISVVPTHFIINPDKETITKTFGLLDKNQLKNLVKGQI